MKYYKNKNNYVCTTNFNYDVIPNGYSAISKEEFDNSLKNNEVENNIGENVDYGHTPAPTVDDAVLLP